MNSAEWEEALSRRPDLVPLLTPRKPLFCDRVPTVKQTVFLLVDALEVLYGGAAGGGKSEALLMAALQYVDVPEYSALLLRRTYTELSLPGAIMDRSHEWLTNTQARWIQSRRTWVFPSGATLSFGYLDRPLDKYRYQSAEFQFIGFDELTQFEESEYTYMFSRLRKTFSNPCPLRMRAASNPGGVGHEWVRHRFISQPESRLFISATVRDNPHLDYELYSRSLAELDPTTRAQLLFGDWDAEDTGILSEDELIACTEATLWPGGINPSPRPAELYIGVDVGRTKNLTVIWVWEQVGDVCWARKVDVLSGASFRVQKAAIADSIDRSTVKVAIDKGGVGYQLAEELEDEFAGVVEGVQLNPGTQGRLAQRLAIGFRERRVRIPDDPELRRDLRSVRKTRVVGGVDRVESQTVGYSHADRFWAAALGFDAALSSGGPIRSSLPRARTRRRIRK